MRGKVGEYGKQIALIIFIVELGIVAVFLISMYVAGLGNRKLY